jgi:hypothetical protein
LIDNDSEAGIPISGCGLLPVRDTGDDVTFATVSIEPTGSNIGAKFWAFIPVVGLVVGIDRTTTKTRAIIANPAQ